VTAIVLASASPARLTVLRVADLGVSLTSLWA
jgi:predicted house-cleaning NTP pyrophosphatase (Maf/HAM1 superfamily)